MLINIADAKARLSELVDAVARGEQVTICNRNEPVAELRAVEPSRKTPRDLSPVFPDWTIDPAFFSPIDGADLEAWYPDASAVDRRVGEGRPAYPPRRRGRRQRP
jgi:prevent-host-death family protein